MKADQEKRRPGRPATGKTPMRYFRMDDDDWAAVEKAAETAGKTTSAFVREAILRAARRIK